MNSKKATRIKTGGKDFLRKEFNFEIIRRSLAENKGNIVRAAKSIGLCPTTFRRKLREGTIEEFLGGISNAALRGDWDKIKENVDRLRRVNKGGVR